MIVHEPEIFEQDGDVRVSSRIEFESSGKRFPERLWFGFPDSPKDFVTDRSDAFVVALLPLAMALGEKMWVRGVVSPRLAVGMAEYQCIQTTWHPDRFKKIELEFGTLAAMEPTQTQDGVATAFSGGVDSFYSLHSHVYCEQIQQYRISHCLMINGFDFNNDNIQDCRLFDQIAQTYRPMLQELNVRLLVAHTNITPFLAESLRVWNIHRYCHGALLSASALVLGRLLRCFYIPSSDPYTDLEPWGSHPMLDHLLSTETMETRHDGAHLSRFEKEAVLAQWPEIYTKLRVCNRRTRIHPDTGALENCCRCEKCLRTMAGFQVIGALDHFSVFPEGLRRSHMWKMINSTIELVEWLEIAGQAFRRGRLGLSLDVLVALLLNLLRKSKRRLLTRFKNSYLGSKQRSPDRIDRQYPQA